MGKIKSNDGARQQLFVRYICGVVDMIVEGEPLLPGQYKLAVYWGLLRHFENGTKRHWAALSFADHMKAALRLEKMFGIKGGSDN